MTESQKQKNEDGKDERDKASKPVRPMTPQEEAGQDLKQLKDPPQAEGDRESAKR